jgi:hypothetical protein
MPELLAILVLNAGFWGAVALGAVGRQAAGVGLALATLPLAVLVWARVSTAARQR